MSSDDKQRTAASHTPRGDLHPIEASALHARRERVFLVFAGLFLGSLTMLNILGVSRFINTGMEIFGQQVWLAVGVLPYPITFLCTDFISEFYGRARANAVVWMGLALNLYVVFFLWLGGALPGQGLDDAGQVIVDAAGAPEHIYYQLQGLAFSAVTASMVAYLVAQFVDVYIFHKLKRWTRGKHLWLRNNGSTLISQLVDSTAVILVTYWAAAEALPIDKSASLAPQLIALIVAGYSFKFLVALADTGIFYIGVRYLREYLQIDPNAEYLDAEPKPGRHKSADNGSDTP